MQAELDLGGCVCVCVCLLFKSISAMMLDLCVAPEFNSSVSAAVYEMRLDLALQPVTRRVSVYQSTCIKGKRPSHSSQFLFPDLGFGEAMRASVGTSKDQAATPS